MLCFDLPPLFRRYTRWFAEDMTMGAGELLSYAADNVDGWRKAIEEWQAPILNDTCEVNLNSNAFPPRLGNRNMNDSLVNAPMNSRTQTGNRPGWKL